MNIQELKDVVLAEFIHNFVVEVPQGGGPVRGKTEGVGKSL